MIDHELKLAQMKSEDKKTVNDGEKGMGSTTCEYRGVKQSLEMFGVKKGSDRELDGGVAVTDHFREVAFSFLI